MTNSPSGWRQACAILQLPFVVTVVVPACVLLLEGAPRLCAMARVVAGTAARPSRLRADGNDHSVLRAFGRGNAGPWDPTRRLVVAGPYRHVRNPMITGVFAVLLGESLVFRSAGLFLWFGTFVAINLVYIPLSRRMRARFGADYDEYAANVPRWIPRRTPWEPPR